MRKKRIYLLPVIPFVQESFTKAAEGAVQAMTKLSGSFGSMLEAMKKVTEAAKRVQ